jgi:hypothetical protein
LDLLKEHPCCTLVVDAGDHSYHFMAPNVELQQISFKGRINDNCGGI